MALCAVTGSHTTLTISGIPAFQFRKCLVQTYAITYLRKICLRNSIVKSPVKGTFKASNRIKDKILEELYLLPHRREKRQKPTQNNHKKGDAGYADVQKKI